MRSSWRTWNRSSTPTRKRTTRRARSCAWMSSRCNWSGKHVLRLPPPGSGRAGSTTSTNGPARPRSSCSASRWPVGGRRRPGLGVRRRTGRWRSPACWKVATPTARRSPWSATTSTRTRRAPSTQCSSRPGHGNWFVGIEFCYTPKHGSWLNIAENELSSLTRQCLHGRRIGDLGTLHDEVSAWSTHVNGTQRGVDWQMKVDDARRKLKSVYPKIVM